MWALKYKLKRWTLHQIYISYFRPTLEYASIFGMGTQKHLTVLNLETIFLTYFNDKFHSLVNETSNYPLRNNDNNAKLTRRTRLYSSLFILSSTQLYNVLRLISEIPVPWCFFSFTEEKQIQNTNWSQTLHDRNWTEIN